MTATQLGAATPAALLPFQTAAIGPRVVKFVGDRSPYSNIVLAMGAIGRAADAVVADLAKPNAELASGSLTATGAQIARKQIAVAALDKLRSPTGEVAKAVARVADDVNQARNSYNRIVAEAERALSPIALQRAVRLADWVENTATIDARTKFAQQVRDGVADAVFAAMTISELSPFGAALHQIARQRLAETAAPADRIREGRALDVLKQLCVDENLAGFDTWLAEIAGTGLEPATSARALLMQANDADRNQLLAEASELGAIEPAPSIAADAARVQSEAVEWRARGPKVGA